MNRSYFKGITLIAVTMIIFSAALLSYRSHQQHHFTFNRRFSFSTSDLRNFTTDNDG